MVGWPCRGHDSSLEYKQLQLDEGRRAAGWLNPLHDKNCKEGTGERWVDPLRPRIRPVLQEGY